VHDDVIRNPRHSPSEGGTYKLNRAAMPTKFRRLRPIGFVLATAVCTGGLTSQSAVPQAEVAPSGPRTGMIVGQVLDSSGAPVPEAIVRMSMPKYPADLPTTPKGRVMADAEGRFFFSDLPAGDYFLQATKEGYAGGEYRQRRVTGRGQPFQLAEGERRVDEKLVLWKFGVISGTVLDEFGEPVVGVSVHGLVKNVIASRTMYGPGEEAPYLMPTTTTDDRGMFRLSRLTPGRYVVVVPSTQTTVPAAMLSTYSQDSAVRLEVMRAIAEVAPLGQPRTQQFGDSALLTLNRMLIPPAASPAGRLEVYRTTYFPSSTTARAATEVAVGAGEDKSGVTISLRPVPTVKITGRLVTPDGTPPPPTSLRLVGDAAAQVGDEGFETVTGVSDASGRFTLLGVPAGDYVLKQATRLVSVGTQGRQGWWVAQPISVGNRDISDLIVTLRPALRVEGRNEFRRSSASSPPVPARLQSNVILVFETPFGEPGRFVCQPRQGEPSFATITSGGQYIARPYEVGGWFVQSVTLDGKDITDRVIDLQEDATNIVVTYTDRASKVTGVVRDVRGTASAAGAVLAFPGDPLRWPGNGTNPRQFKSALTSRTGAYTLEGLPPGDYYLIAIDDAESADWMDPKTLEALARQATRLSIAEGDTKTFDLTLQVIR
jgi:hypothetical protein